MQNNAKYKGGMKMLVICVTDAQMTLGLEIGTFMTLYLN